MEHAPHLIVVPVEKQLERDRAGEQLLTYVACLISDTRDRHDDEVVTDSLPLMRATAKYLLTACDRLRRAALHAAWSCHAAPPSALSEAQRGALKEARLWDNMMRQLSAQHGVVHPLSEMVEPLLLSDAELVQLGVPTETLLNGQDILAL